MSNVKDQNSQNPQGVEQKTFTEENIKEMRTQMRIFYDKEIPLLKKQLQYEDLLAGIEEAKTRKLLAMQKAAYIYAQAEAVQKELDGSDSKNESSASTSNRETKKRTLKTSSRKTE